MSTEINILEMNSAGVLKQIFVEMEKTEQDLKDYVQIIKNWFETQPHLPETPSDNLIGNFLVMNKFSVEKTKPKLDMYYTIRKVIPEFFEGKNPMNERMKRTARTLRYIPFPKPSSNQRIILYNTFTDDITADDYNCDEYFAQMFNFMEMLVNETLFLGFEFIFNCENLKASMVPKISLGNVRKASTVLEKVYSNRIQAIHLLNLHPYIETIFNMAKAILPTKLSKRITVHKDLDSLYENVPRNLLPEDLGGDQPSIEQLHALWMDKMGEYKERFEKLDNMEVIENLRPVPLVNNEILGYHGNFKKLEVD